MTHADLSRRGVLVAGAAASVLPLALAACHSAGSDTHNGTTLATPPVAFLTLAQTATNGLPVDAALAASLYADLSAHHPGLDTHLAELTAALRALDGNADTLKTRPELAAIFADLLSGLYLGITGPLAARRCIAFESIESYALVAGPLSPPSYAGGAPGSWATAAPALAPLPKAK